MQSSGTEGILNYLEISDALATAGQPTTHQFAAIRAAGYDVVVNLAMPDSSNALPDEHELVTAQGMDYVHIPVVWENPTLQDLEQFFHAVARYRGKRILVHCAMNMRVSAFVLLYRVLSQGARLEVAREAMLSIWEPNEVWQSFLDNVLADEEIKSKLRDAGA